MGNNPQLSSVLEYLSGLALIQLFVIKVLHVVDDGKFFVRVPPQFPPFWQNWLQVACVFDFDHLASTLLQRLNWAFRLQRVRLVVKPENNVQYILLGNSGPNGEFWRAQAEGYFVCVSEDECELIEIGVEFPDDFVLTFIWWMVFLNLIVDRRNLQLVPLNDSLNELAISILQTIWINQVNIVVPIVLRIVLVQWGDISLLVPLLFILLIYVLVFVCILHKSEVLGCIFVVVVSLKAESHLRMQVH